MNVRKYSIEIDYHHFYFTVVKDSLCSGADIILISFPFEKIDLTCRV